MSPLLAEAEGPPCGSIPQPLRSLFAEAAVKYPNNTAVASLYQQPVHGLHCLLAADTGTLIWTYGQLEKAADLLAISLYDQGIRKGMRIAAFLFNSAEWALLFWSSLKLGAIFVPLDARSVSRQEEAQHYLKVVDPAVLVVADNSAAAILQRQNALDVPESVLRMVASPDGPFHQGWIPLHSRVEEAVMSKTRLEEIYEPQNDDMQDIVMTIFTSGTSGLPKACPHTNMTLWMSYQGVSSVRIFGPDDRVVQHLPPSHSYACLDMLQSWVDGAAVVYASQSFDAKATLDAVESMHCTYISGEFD